MQYLLTQDEYDEYQRFKNSFGALKEFVESSWITEDKQTTIRGGRDFVTFTIETCKLPKIFKILLRLEQ